jgi:hypothetical protein
VDDIAREVAAMQFAGGMSIARVAEQWEQGPEWVEESIRRALLQTIPKRSGGLKPSRTELRAERSDEAQAAEGLQGTLELEP